MSSTSIRLIEPSDAPVLAGLLLRGQAGVCAPTGGLFATLRSSPG